jgi:hypothetical protein
MKQIPEGRSITNSASFPIFPETLRILVVSSAFWGMPGTLQ